MSPTPTRIAVMISLIGAGITWSDHANAHAPLVSSAVETLDSDAAIHRALGLEQWPWAVHVATDATVTESHATVHRPRSTAKAHATRAKRSALKSTRGHSVATLHHGQPAIIAASGERAEHARKASTTSRVAPAKSAPAKRVLVASDKVQPRVAVTPVVGGGVATGAVVDRGDAMTAWLADVDVPLVLSAQGEPASTGAASQVARSADSDDNDALRPFLADLEGRSVTTLAMVEAEASDASEKFERQIQEVELRAIEDRQRHDETLRKRLVVAAPRVGPVGGPLIITMSDDASASTLRPLERLVSVEPRSVFKRQPLLPIVHDRTDTSAPLKLILPMVPLDRLEALPTRSPSIDQIQVASAPLLPRVAVDSEAETTDETPARDPVRFEGLLREASIVVAPVVPLRPLERSRDVAISVPASVEPLTVALVQTSDEARAASPPVEDAPTAAARRPLSTLIVAKAEPQSPAIDIFDPTLQMARSEPASIDIFDPALRSAKVEPLSIDIFDPALLSADKDRLQLAFDIFDPALGMAGKVEPRATVAAAIQLSQRRRGPLLMTGLGDQPNLVNAAPEQIVVPEERATASAEKVQPAPTAKPRDEVELASAAAASESRAKLIAELAIERPNPLQGELVALSDDRLDGMRAGFDNGTGLSISFGIERAVYVNGSLVTTTSLNVSDLSRMTAGQVAQSLGVDRTTLGVVQTGPNNFFNPGQVASGSVATVIQNSLDNQKIQGVTLVNATVNSLDVTRRTGLQNSIQNGVTSSLRR